MLFEDGKPQDFIYLDVNKAFETLTGLKDVAGKKVSEVISGVQESNPELFEIYGRVALTGKPEKIELYVAALNSWLFISVYRPKLEHFARCLKTSQTGRNQSGPCSKAKHGFATCSPPRPMQSC